MSNFRRWPFIVGMSVLATLLITLNLVHLFSAAPSSPTGFQQQMLLFTQSSLPRIVIALIAGAGLGLAGWLCQLALKNPLAEPATLGISSGAQLGVAVAALLGSGLTLTPILSLIGGSSCALLIYLLSMKRGLSPLSLLLTGMILSLFCSALQTVVVLFHHEQIQSLFIWGSGNLSQNDWSGVRNLLPVLFITLLSVLLLARPLNLLRLSDDVIDSMGANSRQLRLVCLILMTIVSAFIVSQVGIISFVGLFAPHVVRGMTGINFRKQCTMVMAFAALLLLICDQVAVLAEYFQWQITAGNLTAIIGIPLMLWIIARLHFVTPPALPVQRSTQRSSCLRIVSIVLLIAILVIASGITHDVQHWLLSWRDPYNLRWPRALMAACCGGLLACTGVILQRLTGNPLASPEVLGINGGAACGVVLLLLFVPSATNIALFPAAVLGALISLVVIIAFALTSGRQTARILLVGTALGSFSVALISLFLASNTPNAARLITWLSGSTWNATPSGAITALSALLLCIPISLLFTRWLTILPLGSDIASSLGVSLRVSSSLLIIWCALVSAGATLLLGPMSFVGLLAPQAAKALGCRYYSSTLLCSAFVGGVLMLFADMISRIIFWPFQLPTGVIAVIVGAPVLLLMLFKRQ